MRIIAIIEGEVVARKLREHLNFREEMRLRRRRTFKNRQAFSMGSLL
jgi:hypothetical protein